METIDVDERAQKVLWVALHPEIRYPWLSSEDTKLIWDVCRVDARCEQEHVDGAVKLHLKADPSISEDVLSAAKQKALDQIEFNWKYIPLSGDGIPVSVDSPQRRLSTAAAASGQLVPYQSIAPCGQFGAAQYPPAPLPLVPHQFV